jgi:hypothetical protein
MEQRTEDKEQRSETWNRGWQAKGGNKEQRCETRNRGWETRYRDVREGTVDGK